MFLEYMEMFLNFLAMHNLLYFTDNDKCSLLNFGVISALVQALQH